MGVLASSLRLHSGIVGRKVARTVFVNDLVVNCAEATSYQITHIRKYIHFLLTLNSTSIISCNSGENTYFFLLLVAYSFSHNNFIATRKSVGNL